MDEVGSKHLINQIWKWESLRISQREREKEMKISEEKKEEKKNLRRASRCIAFVDYGRVH